MRYSFCLIVCIIMKNKQKQYTVKKFEEKSYGKPSKNLINNMSPKKIYIRIKVLNFVFISNFDCECNENLSQRNLREKCI